MPKAREADCGVAFRDPEHIAYFTRGQTLQIQQGDSRSICSSRRTASSRSPRRLSSRRQRAVFVERDLTAALALPPGRIRQRDIMRDA